jgi:hypothetical protein
MFGVERFLLPLKLRSPQPWSSVRMTTRFGLLATSGEQTDVKKRIRRPFTIFIMGKSWK